MALLDARNEFCDAIALNTGGAGTYLVGSQIDLAAANSILEPPDLWVVIEVDTAVTSGGAGTYGFALASDDSAAIATDGSATIHLQTAQIAKTTLVAGYQVMAAKLPRGTYERYLGILQTTAVAAATAGKINAYLTPNAPKWAATADAI